MRPVAAMSLCVLIAFAAGCGEPCDKSLAKMQKCWKVTQKKDENPADAAIYMQVCKAERSKFVKCMKITDCGEYSKCISEASTDPRAVEILKQNAEAVTGDAPAAPADMPAAPADMPAAPADMPAAPADAPADMPAAPADTPADMPAAPADTPAAPADMK
ncbi:hypothetical protein KJ612_16060 [Myxococcota bacterium]|nr:hypothetical protein [Myxococcota bacterium]MBU1413373.1 hypothetical protein [Myxococcota bacterium]